jgi:hypothetical protein
MKKIVVKYKATGIEAIRKPPMHKPLIIPNKKKIANKLRCRNKT